MADEKLAVILRSVTKSVELFPFIYTAVLLFLCPFEAFLSLRWAELLALFISTSVPSTIFCVALSYAVELCPWHRAQCFIMLLPLAIPLCRIVWPEVNIVWMWVGVSVLLLASLVNAYFVFVKPSVRK